MQFCIKRGERMAPPIPGEDARVDTDAQLREFERIKVDANGVVSTLEELDGTLEGIVQELRRFRTMTMGKPDTTSVYVKDSLEETDTALKALSSVRTDLGEARLRVRQMEGGIDRSWRRLSDGPRINSAKDDAAGLGISEGLRAEIRSMGQAKRNANDGISMLQTAEGALDQIGENLVRLRELAVEASDGQLNEDQRRDIDESIQRLIAELDLVGSDMGTIDDILVGIGRDLDTAVEDLSPQVVTLTPTPSPKPK